MFEVKRLFITGKYVVINKETGARVTRWNGKPLTTRSLKKARRIRDRRIKWFKKLMLNS